MASELSLGLEIDTVAMERNLAFVSASEHLLSVMSARLGKHRAQELLQNAYREAREQNRPLGDLLDGVATDSELAELSSRDLGASGMMVDRVVESARRRRSSEPEHWQ